MPDTRVAAIVGPTAVGKTEVSVQVAERLDAEIVSVDSMQVYRGLDIGTAKVDAATRRRVPHHLIDIRPPDVDVTVAEFQRLARAAIADIHGRGWLPLLVGGSGLYLRAVVDDLRFPARSPRVRAALEAEADDVGAESLHARLAALDPAAAARIEPGNARRTVRALEVIEVTGRPFSDNTSWEEHRSIYDLRVAGLSLDRPRLYDAIAGRVDTMLEQGLVDEARKLAPHIGRTARQALGYRQILDHPDADEADVRDAIVRATKRFARRQESWFRSDPRVVWFDASNLALQEQLVAYLTA
ncbi:MAG TPA: tRNA (adenosine(37)-N6)-dimethylallyltransferase MiaA [Actinomycetota bacterium]|nr:tRNA (adenosine(37)-N6)-dimethylallyltransferase MiaA [Actinomycetota bacterium]